MASFYRCYVVRNFGQNGLSVRGEASSLGECIVGVESTDKMTDHRVVAKVRERSREILLCAVPHRPETGSCRRISTGSATRW
jgi:hypothetical protein